MLPPSSDAISACGPGGRHRASSQITESAQTNTYMEASQRDHIKTSEFHAKSRESSD